MKKYLFILMMLLLTLNVFSASVWIDLGNSGNFAVGYDGYLFSSAYTQTNFNGTEYDDAITNKYYPILYRPLDSTLDITQYVYTFSETGITVYRGEDRVQISSYTDDILSQPYLINIAGSTGVELVYISDESGQKSLKFLRMNENSLLDVKSCGINENVTALKTGFPFNNNIVLVNPSQNNFYVIDADVCSGSTTGLIYFHNVSLPANTVIPSSEKINQSTFSEYLNFKDVNKDGKYEVVLTLPTTVGTNSIYHVIYNNNSQSCNTTINFGVTMSSANLLALHTQTGLTTGTYETYIYYGHRTSNVHNYAVVDSSCNVLQQSTGSGIYRSVGAVADYDKDGQNELCQLEGSSSGTFMNLTCRSSSGTIEVNKITNAPVYTASTSDRNDPYYIGIAEFNNATSYMEFLLYDGMYSYDGENLSILYNYSSDKAKLKKLPVSLYSKVAFAKDIFFYDDDEVSYLYSGLPPSVCGDGVCSPGETVVTCSADCLSSTTASEGEYCTENANCSTGKCFYNECVLKVTNEVCSADNQCRSGDCNNGRCTKTSLFTNLDAGKDDLVGDDDNTNDLISLIIIIGAIIAVIGTIMYLSGSQHIGASIIVAAAFVTMNLIAILLTTIGWLSAWIMFVIVLVDVVIIIIAILSGFNMSGR